MTVPDRRTAAFRAAVGVAALHALWVAFAAPEPQTTAGDHLAAGLVPAAGALVAAWAYPRLPGAGRALLAAACGVWAAAAGGALAPARSRSPWPAWPPASCSSRSPSSRRSRWSGAAAGGRAAWSLHATAVAVATAAGALYLVVPVAFAVLATHRAPADPVRADLGRPPQEVTLTARDGVRAPPAATSPRAPAPPSSSFPAAAQAAVHRARLLVRRGHGVLLLDPRGAGASGGDFNARGWQGEPDVTAAIDFLTRRPDVHPRRVGGVGLSVGGELLLQAAAHDPRLRAVVCQSRGRRSMAEQRHLPGVAPALRWVSPALVETGATVALTGHGPPPDLAALAARVAPRPVLLLAARHGHEDERLNRVYRDAAPRTTTLWEVPRGGASAPWRPSPAPTPTGCSASWTGRWPDEDSLMTSS